MPTFRLNWEQIDDQQYEIAIADETYTLFDFSEYAGRCYVDNSDSREVTKSHSDPIDAENDFIGFLGTVAISLENRAKEVWSLLDDLTR